MDAAELIESYLEKNAKMGYGSVHTNKPRKVTPGRQGHWRPRRLQRRQLRANRKHGRVARRLPTGRRRRRAIMASMRNRNMPLAKTQELIDKYKGGE